MPFVVFTSALGMSLVCPWYVLTKTESIVCVIYPPLMASTNGVADMIVVDAVYTESFAWRLWSSYERLFKH